MTEASSTQIHLGSCLCGAVRYQVKGPLRDVTGCHCGQCRKTSGNYVTATAAERETLEIEGQDEVTWYVSSPGLRRGFCSRCGSNLFWDNPARSYMSLFAGALDLPTGLTLTKHIFVADKGDYYTLGDGLPQFEAYD